MSLHCMAFDQQGHAPEVRYPNLTTTKHGLVQFIFNDLIVDNLSALL